MTPVHTIDLHFLQTPHVVASFLVEHPRGAVLVDCGPGSTLPALEAGLQSQGLTTNDVTDVLLTHIHLDHAGAAGELARRGARIHAHPIGVPHLIRPEKLIASAARIYGDRMEKLWGEILPVPEDRVVVPQDDRPFDIEGLSFTALSTPGHAEHHYAYVLGDVCFTGDVGGIRLPGPPHLRVPMPPPEFHLERWRESVRRLQSLSPGRLAAAHFGIFDDVRWHLDRLARALDEVEQFMLDVMPADPSLSELNERFLAWTRDRSQSEGLTDELLVAYEWANPSSMSAAGMQRYWKKYRP
jgi:glyoxylase-like metal-dependent hydrolase (beta-lactamase superfamily II)